MARFLKFLAGSPLLLADHKHSELGDPLLALANVFDFGKLAKTKLDPLAWDYMDEGSEDEISLRDNRERFNNLIIRPHLLLHDISKIDTSTTLFGSRKVSREFCTDSDLRSHYCPCHVSCAPHAVWPQGCVICPRP